MEIAIYPCMKLVDVLNDSWFNATNELGVPRPFSFWYDGNVYGILFNLDCVWISEDSEPTTMEELANHIVQLIDKKSIQEKQFVARVAFEPIKL